MENYRNSNPFNEDKISLVEKTQWSQQLELVLYIFEYNNDSDILEMKIERRDLLENSEAIPLDIIKYEYDMIQLEIRFRSEI